MALVHNCCSAFELSTFRPRHFGDCSVLQAMQKLLFCEMRVSYTDLVQRDVCIFRNKFFIMYISCTFQARSQNCEKRQLHVSPSARMEELCCHWTDLYET